MKKGIVIAVVMLAVAAIAQGTDIAYAYVDFSVNADATVTAARNGTIVSMVVTAATPKILAVPLGGVSSVWYTGRERGRLNIPTIINLRGNITLRLPAQSYQQARITLLSVNGKRILRGKAVATETASAISHNNVAAGVYLLSVKGINGSAFTTRLTHNGGNVNINIAFGSGSVPHDRKLAKSAAGEEEWEINVSADGYVDSTYKLILTSGNYIRQQVIRLKRGTLFVDSRDGKSYRKLSIGSQTWMAENLNYDAEGSKCYKNSPDSCAKYGRLYNYATAMNGASSSDAVPSGIQGVCPVGWHLPSDAEWTQLTDFVGPNAGSELRSSAFYGGTDTYEFSALPGGMSGSASDDFEYVGSRGYWRSATERESTDNNSYAWVWSIYQNQYGFGVFRNGYFTTNLYSVRCVAD